MLLLADQPLLILLVALAAGCLLGALFLHLLRLKDHFTWVLARAPQLPIRVLAGGDDAWIRGTVHCEQPLRCPWFDVPCVSYSYRIENKVTVTRRDKDGKTHTTTEWKTEHSDSRSTDFVVDDGQRITVRMQQANNEAQQGLGTDYQSSDRRHSASALQLGVVVSVLGVKQDDGSFAGEREVPCLITRKERSQRLQGSRGSETWLFGFACFWPFAGGGVATWAVLAQWIEAQPLGWLLVLLGALLAMLPYWWIAEHNRLVRLRQQVLAAFRQVDVDLAVRAQLVPNLVAVVRGAAGHEQTLLTGLAAIRSGLDPAGAVAAERTALAATRQVLLLHERQPQLRADAVYRDLHDRLWAIEEKLAHTRSLYNDVVTEWNNRIATLPSQLVARACSYRPAPPFLGEDAELPPPLRAPDGG